MSRPAWEYLTTHLPEIRRATFPDPSSKTGTRSIGEPGLALLLYLSGQTNKQGQFFMTAKVMQEECDIATLRQVEKLLAAFIHLGWITPTGETVQYMETGRPTPVYVLTLFPQYARDYAGKLNKSAEIPSPGTVEKSSKANWEKDYTKNTVSESQPKPETEPQPEPGSQKSDDLQAGRQRKDQEVLILCIGLEIESMSKRNRVVKPGLRKKWEQEYLLLIAKAIEQREGSTTEALAQYCFDTRTVERTGYTSSDTPAQVPTTKRPKEVCGRCENKNRDIEGHEGLTTQWDEATRTFSPCELCNGTGYHEREPLTEYDYFPADEEPTPIEPPTERVSAGVISNTHIPTPPGSADPQSFTQFVKDMSQNFTHK